MMSRLLSVFFVLAVLAGCKSSECTKEETPSDLVEQGKGIEDRELYWYQRGTDSTRAIWAKYRLSNDVALLADGKGDAAPSFNFATQVFSLLLDNVSTFWRKDLAAEAVAAYFGDFSSVYPDRAANGRSEELAARRAHRRAMLAAGEPPRGQDPHPNQSFSTSCRQGRIQGLRYLLPRDRIGLLRTDGKPEALDRRVARPGHKPHVPVEVDAAPGKDERLVAADE